MGEEANRSRSEVAKALVEHGALVGRVCMALLGDRESTEQALERVAREAGANGVTSKVALLGLAQKACATRMSKLPVRRGATQPVAPVTQPATQLTGPPAPIADAPGAPVTARLPGGDASAAARAEMAKLKPTERDAVVLHLIGGLDAAEVAIALGIDAPTARARIANGISTLVTEVSR